ncbi:MAG: DMT family transporter [Actinomycetota bacterium]|nr:DMT family transporter [Actinomycetota bacterium]
MASVALALYALVVRMRLPDARDLPAVLISGFLAFGVYHVALNYGQRTVSAGAASILIGTAPIFTALWATAFLGERLRVWGWAGFAIGLVGATLVSMGEGGGFALDPGALLVLLAALCVSVYFVLQKPYLEKYGALPFTTYAIWVGTLISLCFLPGLVAQAGTAPAGTLFSMFYLGVFPTALGYVTYAYAFSRMPASRAVSFLYLIPVVAYLIAWIWLGEVPAALSVIGGVVTLSGVVIVNTLGKQR